MVKQIKVFDISTWLDLVRGGFIMLIKDILKLVSTIDNRKLPDDIEKMLKRLIWSESKEYLY